MDRHVEFKSVCGCCSIRERCLPAGLNDREMYQLDQFMEHRIPVKKGTTLYTQGQSMAALYAISTGSFKTRLLREDGRSQIMGFYLSGDIMGLDAISTDQHVCDAIALEDSTVCKIPYRSFEELEHSIQQLQRSFNKTLSQEIVRDQSTMLLLGSMRSEERVAAFLIGLSERYYARQQSSTELILRMTREDIGNYLGLKLETVSRILSQLTADKIITVQGRHIRITNNAKLHSISLER